MSHIPVPFCSISLWAVVHFFSGHPTSVGASAGLPPSLSVPPFDTSLSPPYEPWPVPWYERGSPLSLAASCSEPRDLVDIQRVGLPGTAGTFESPLRPFWHKHSPEPEAVWLWKKSTIIAYYGDIVFKLAMVLAVRLYSPTDVFLKPFGLVDSFSWVQWSDWTALDGVCCGDWVTSVGTVVAFINASSSCTRKPIDNGVVHSGWCDIPRAKY